MSRAKKNYLICFISLIIGSLLYILLRPNTDIARLLAEFVYLTKLQQICQLNASAFLKFYLPDFLWALSLGCGLIAVNNPKHIGIIGCSFASFLCGLIWELLQYYQIIKGTGDIHDIIMYFLASTVCIIINIKESPRS